MPKNYYLVLGVGSSATLEEIKAAFRRRAMELHPDRSGLESGPFLELQEAYGVLSDPTRRRRYDEHGGATIVQRKPWGRGAEPLVHRRRGEPFAQAEAGRSIRDVSIEDSFHVFHPSFDELFERLWSNFENVARPKSERLDSLTVEVVINPVEAIRGGQVRVRIPGKATCPTCGGHGALGAFECWRCAGSGTMAVDYPLDIEFPSGIRDGHIVQVSLEEFGIGNFYLTIVFRISDEFEEL